MKIKLDDSHFLISESTCCWVVALSKSKNGKMYERRVSGYYNSLDKCLDSYFTKHINESETSSIRALRKDIAETRNRIQEWVHVLRKEQDNGN